MFEVRRSAERGFADHGWLRTFHTFSFADYVDPAHMGFGPLRVINEDFVAPGQGFGTHGHRDMEIITYVLAGELQHKDSMGNGSVIRPGDVQRMSAGTGVTHSEFNPSSTDLVHLLQIWIIPDVKGIAPEYEQRFFPPTGKRGRLRLIASPDGSDGSVTIHQDARVCAARLEGEEELTIKLATGRLGYLHIARGSVAANGTELKAGDGLKFSKLDALRVNEGRDAEWLYFDLPLE
jgi:redox-sensitive bicupin YhaK (pirin superfamily)